MPLPFLIAGAVIAAGIGIKKGLDAKEDFDTAEAINRRAQRDFDEAQKKLQTKRLEVNENLQRLGRTKFEIYTVTIPRFVELFEKIKNVEFKDLSLNGEALPMTRSELKDLKAITLAGKELAVGGVTALGAGGLAGLAAYGGALTLATASTGTAIGTLSGVAATNATLAWFGGGSIAAGGLGMAGGMAVLGGIVAGPVLALGGFILSAKAKAAIDDARANRAQAELAVEQMNSAWAVADSIQIRVNEFQRVLSILDAQLTEMTRGLTKLVTRSSDYKTYSQAERESVMAIVLTAKLIKDLLCVHVIDEAGATTQESAKALADTRKALALT
ncbi:MAG: hypothetical protein RL095_283 [Verrucomicrobiota bacterium]|jgi:hypothetical protein